LVGCGITSAWRAAEEDSWSIELGEVDFLNVRNVGPDDLRSSVVACVGVGGMRIELYGKPNVHAGLLGAKGHATSAGK